jgi:hypothetical protein
MVRSDLTLEKGLPARRDQAEPWKSTHLPPRRRISRILPEGDPKRDIGDPSLNWRKDLLPRDGNGKPHLS